jgi:hypothetical protein
VRCGRTKLISQYPVSVRQILNDVILTLTATKGEGSMHSERSLAATSQMICLDSATL